MPLDDVRRLADLIRRRNQLDAEIASIIGRPAEKGHFGEWLASQLFDVELETSATQAGFDGRFRSGPHAGKTLNVKFYAKREGLLDINPVHVPDFYLVFTGPKAAAVSSKGGTRPWCISEVFLFDANALVRRLTERGVKIGIATSVGKAEWEAARVYPGPSVPAEVAEVLGLFGEVPS